MPIQRSVKIAVIVVISGGLMFAAYARFIEPRWLRKTTHSLVLPEATLSQGGVSRMEGKLPAPLDPLRLAHLTDTHYTGAGDAPFLEKAFRETIAEKPDLICLTGDFITDHLRDRETYVRLLKILSDAAPTFACPGNHDGGTWARERGGYPDLQTLESLLAEAGVVLLENRAELREIGGRKILVAGSGDLWALRMDLPALEVAMLPQEADVRILLTHNPDSKSQLEKLPWDLMLAGHTHGGQLYVPGLGAPFAPVRDKSTLNGLYAYSGRALHVSPGLGSLHGLRFNCRPEINILELGVGAGGNL